MNKWTFIKNLVFKVLGAPGYAEIVKHITCPQEVCNLVNLVKTISHQHIHKVLTSL